MNRKVLVTGAAGFIGSAVCDALLDEGAQVYGIDNFSDYYDISLKKARLERVQSNANSKNFSFSTLDIANFDELCKIFESFQPTEVVHVAAQASVRYDDFNVYTQTNLVGHMNILQCCRKLYENEGTSFKHLVYASSSSVYGSNEKTPFEETDRVEKPKSLYAATKRCNELLSYSYANMYNLPCTGLRFFTVYGPWGRPDMAPILFAKNIMEEKPIKVFNKGDLWRDFTYIDDIVKGITSLLNYPPKASKNQAPADVFNIGNSKPVQLLDFIKTMEKALGKKAILDLQPWPPTEVYKTYADTTKLATLTGYKPNTSLEQGLNQFATWFKNEYTK